MTSTITCINIQLQPHSSVDNSIWTISIDRFLALFYTKGLVISSTTFLQMSLLIQTLKSYMACVCILRFASHRPFLQVQCIQAPCHTQLLLFFPRIDFGCIMHCAAMIASEETTVYCQLKSKVPRESWYADRPFLSVSDPALRTSSIAVAGNYSRWIHPRATASVW
jgi:hypothetical protein